MKKLSDTLKELGIKFTFPIEIADANGNQTYFENSSGYWDRLKYDENGNQTYYENSDGFWSRCEYDEKGNQTYYENSNGFWYRYEYDKNGKVTYYENSNDFWSRREYDENGNRTYYENSDGLKEGTKRSSCSGKVLEVDGKKYKLTAVKDYEYKAPAWVNWPV
jgi:YD repeat-containing protein